MPFVTIQSDLQLISLRHLILELDQNNALDWVRAKHTAIKIDQMHRYQLPSVC